MQACALGSAAGSKPKKGKKAAAVPRAGSTQGLSSALSSARAAAHTCVHSLLVVLRPVEEMLAAQCKDEACLAAHVAEQAPVEPCWSWQTATTFHAGQCLGHVVRAQHAVVCKLCAQLAHLSASVQNTKQAL